MRTIKYIPLFLLILFNIILYYLFKEVSDRLITGCSLSQESLSLLKFFIFPSLSVLLSIYLLVLSKRQTPYQIAIKANFLLIISTILLTLCLYFERESALCQTVSLSKFSEILFYWKHALSFLLTQFWTPISLLLFYGYLNEKMTLKEASKLYPLFGIFAMISSEILIKNIFPIGASWTTSSLILNAGIFSTLLFLSSLLVYKLLEHQTPTEKPETNYSKVCVSIIILLGLLSVSVEFSKFLSIIYSKSPLTHQNPLNNLYELRVHHISFFKGLAIFTAIITLFFLRMYIQQYQTKGWKHFFYGVALLTTITSTALIFFSFSNVLLKESYWAAYGTAIYKRILHIGTNYQMFLNVISYPTFICLFQMIITKLKRNERFIAQIVITLLLHKMGYFLSLLFNSIAYSIEGFTTSFWIFLTTVFLVTALGRLYCIHFISQRLEHKVD